MVINESVWFWFETFGLNCLFKVKSIVYHAVNYTGNDSWLTTIVVQNRHFEPKFDVFYRSFRKPISVLSKRKAKANEKKKKSWVQVRIRNCCWQPIDWKPSWNPSLTQCSWSSRPNQAESFRWFSGIFQKRQKYVFH